MEESHTVLSVTNVGEGPCTINGYGKLTFLDAQGNSLPTDRYRLHAGPSAKPISLSPGQVAVMDLWWSVQESPCVDPRQLRVTPPQGSESITVGWGLGAVCDGNRVETGPFLDPNNLHG